MNNLRLTGYFNFSPAIKEIMNLVVEINEKIDKDMTKQERKDKRTAMVITGIPADKRGAFIRWANKWGRFNVHGDKMWYEYGPLEAHQRCTRTMKQMWEAYLMVRVDKVKEYLK